MAVHFDLEGRREQIRRRVQHGRTPSRGEDSASAPANEASAGEYARQRPSQSTEGRHA